MVHAAILSLMDISRNWPAASAGAGLCGLTITVYLPPHVQIWVPPYDPFQGYTQGWELITRDSLLSLTFDKSGSSLGASWVNEFKAIGTTLFYGCIYVRLLRSVRFVLVKQSTLCALIAITTRMNYWYSYSFSSYFFYYYFYYCTNLLWVSPLLSCLLILSGYSQIAAAA